ncbi:hypothetical protein QBC42DRAFT_292971 [Cladorrhinum samala]|uniref:Carrier domain-containing protein n=1 Tax=Cladorrhinum samala TaxID=585594 RepID=A0AAV9I1B5_9PEZI|nr:hypothetical protein QBC42DRAFT_292971 [Cladorrhinum samala]
MRPLTSVIDHLAVEKPDAPWVKIPTSEDINSITWRDFTWSQLGKAVDLMAHWIEKNLGPPASTSERIAYVGVNDVRCPIVVFAAEKTGYKPLLLSPRNSLEGHSALLTATHCKHVLHSTELAPQARQLSKSSLDKLQSLEIPSLESLTNISRPIAPYPTKCPKLVHPQTTFMTLHSSGTTALPKPIDIKAGVLAITESLAASLPTPDGRLNGHDPLYLTPLIVGMPPFFHAFGFNMVLRSIYYQNPLVVFPSGIPPTAELMVRAIEQTRPTAIVATPSMLEDVCALPGGLDALGRLEYIYSGGAPLAKECGGHICRRTRLVNGIGSTEAWTFTTLVPVDPEDWEYFEWNDRAGIVMEPVPSTESDGGVSDRLAELVIKRRPGPEGSRFQFVFKNFKHLDEWRTRDLYERHWDGKKRDKLWRYVGRMDDVVVLSNGEKVNPVLFEKEVEGCPLVHGAVVVGERRFQTGLIIEPQGTVEDADKYLDEIWPWIEKANAKCAAHARVWPSMVILADKRKPLHRTPKGSVMRRPTLQLYESEINDLYGNKINNNDNQQEQTGDSRDQNVDAASVVREAVTKLAEGDLPLDDGTNFFFQLGFDSLKVLQLAHLLAGRLPRALANAIRPRLIYQNPTISKIVSALAPSSGASHTSTIISREQQIVEMINKYSSIPNPFLSTATYQNTTAPATNPKLPADPSPGPFNVLLTGSTGSLGTYLLSSLLSDPSVSRVFCLNRTADAALRQASSFSSRGLPAALDPSRVTFLHAASLSELDDHSLPEQLKDAAPITHIIHNAWPVNFNLPLDAFSPSVHGTANLVHLASACFPGARLVFISSVSAAFNYKASSGGGVPERFDADAKLPAELGYAQSKHAAGCVVADAVGKGRLRRASIVRLGQVAGSADGRGPWNMHEWVPSLIGTSLALGKIPAELRGRQANVDWVPVDWAAEAVLDLCLRGDHDVDHSKRGGGDGGLDCWNLVNPEYGDWGELVSAVKKYYAARNQGKELEVVGAEEWVDELRKVATSSVKDGDDGRGENTADGAYEKYPAVKLLEFFEESAAGGRQGGIVFETERAKERSEAMRGMKKVDGEMMGRWLEGWGF